MPEINDVKISSQKPTSWDDFLSVLKGTDVPTEFLDKKERDQGGQERDSFEGWVE